MAMTIYPLRGELWWSVVPGAGVHPVLVLTNNAQGRVLGSLTIALVTGTLGPATTHVRFNGPELGLRKYEESFINCSDLHTLDKPRFRQRIARLPLPELHTVEKTVRMILSL